MSLVYGLFNLNGYFGSVFFEVVENIMATSPIRPIFISLSIIAVGKVSGLLWNLDVLG